MFPKQALRELIANALTHQDFSITGTSVMIELFINRVEISSPGMPRIDWSDSQPLMYWLTEIYSLAVPAA